MKATYKQIDKALDNSFEFGVDGDQATYDAIRGSFSKAYNDVGIQKSPDFFTKSDWKAVHKRIKELIS